MGRTMFISTIPLIFFSNTISIRFGLFPSELIHFDLQRKKKEDIELSHSSKKKKKSLECFLSSFNHFIDFAIWHLQIWHLIHLNVLVLCNLLKTRKNAKILLREEWKSGLYKKNHPSRTRNPINLTEPLETVSDQ